MCQVLFVCVCVFVGFEFLIDDNHCQASPAGTGAGTAPGPAALRTSIRAKEALEPGQAEVPATVGTPGAELTCGIRPAGGQGGFWKTGRGPTEAAGLPGWRTAPGA